MGALSGMSSFNPVVPLVWGCWGRVGDTGDICAFFFYCDMRCLAVGQLSRLSD
jgi:hypothetical protein